MIEYAIYDGALEYRAKGRRLRGSFPYNATATIADRGVTRKETFKPDAFAFSLKDADRVISLLRGHDFDKALAVRSPKFRSLELEDTATALNFEATLPPVSQQSQHVRDTLLDVQNGLLAGISPGFKVPPRDVVPDAEDFLPEPGNPAVEIRVISHAVLLELSLVHRPSYKTSSVELRHDHGVAHDTINDELRRRVMIWL